ncbi:MAG: hypothetical protein WB421_17490, partial [Terriglobales bacterium]
MLISKIVSDLVLGLKIFVTSDSKKTVDFLFALITEMHPSIRILKYTSDSGAEARRMLQNPDVSWHDSACVICSPTVVYGTDHTDPLHFDYQAHLFCGKSIPPSACFQQIGRVRRTLSHNVYVHIDKYTAKKIKAIKGEKMLKRQMEIHSLMTRLTRSLNSDYVSNFSERGIRSFGVDLFFKRCSALFQPLCREICEQGRALVADLSYRLYFYQYVSMFMQEERMLTYLEDQARDCGYPVTTGKFVFTHYIPTHYVKEVKKSLLDLRNGDLVVCEPLVSEFDQERKNDAMKKTVFHEDKEEDKVVLRELTWMQEMGIVIKKDLTSTQLNSMRIPGTSINSRGAMYLKNMELLIQDPDKIFEQMRRDQFKNYFLLRAVEVMPVHIALVLISFFWNTPLIMSRTNPGWKVEMAAKDDLKLVCSFMQKILDEIWFGTANLMCYASFAHLTFGSIGLHSDAVRENWNRKEVVALLQAVVKCLFNIRVVSKLAKRNLTHGGEVRIVYFDMNDRDSLLELMFSRTVHWPTEFKISSSYVGAALSECRTVFKHEEFTCIPQQVYVCAETFVEHYEAPILIDDRDFVDAMIDGDFEHESLADSVDGQFV